MSVPDTTVTDDAPPETALAVRPKREKAIEPTMQRAVIMKAHLKGQKEQRKLLADFVKEHMVEGTDFGTVPGTDRKSLLKPGAEKLTDLYLCTAKFVIAEKIEDWEKGFFHYLFKVEIVARDAPDVALAEGFGSCNSREGKYRWRNGRRACPACGKSDPFMRSKEKPEYFCWRKKDGCGATFGLNDPKVTSQEVGKVENDDPFTLANTILKMAKKRAHVDAAIALARCSDMFTQDVEDDVDHAPPAPRNVEPPIHPAQQLANMMLGAKSLAELEEIAQDLAQLRTVFTNARKRLAPADPPPPTSSQGSSSS